ncbi:class I SAM-dependent DNA methyltransferase [Caminibacter sp.]
MNRFDKDAQTWDDLPRRVNLAKAVVKNVAPLLQKSDRVLEFGCGTGLVGINIAPFVKEVKGIDTSIEMIKKFNEKAKKFAPNAYGEVKDIFKENEKYDAIISSMTIHHIKDIKALSIKLTMLTNRVFLADLFKEDGSFHTRGNEDVMHFGFSEEELREYFSEWNIKIKKIHTIKKHKNFDVFLAELTK